MKQNEMKKKKNPSFDILGSFLFILGDLKLKYSYTQPKYVSIVSLAHPKYSWSNPRCTFISGLLWSSHSLAQTWQAKSFGSFWIQMLYSKIYKIGVIIYKTEEGKRKIICPWPEEPFSQCTRTVREWPHQRKHFSTIGKPPTPPRRNSPDGSSSWESNLLCTEVDQDSSH